MSIDIRWVWFVSWLLNSAAISAPMAAQVGCDHTPTQFSCVRYLRNYDADTITVEISDVHPLLGHEAQVRVNGIDAPEVRTKDACEAKAADSARLRAKEILTAAKRIDLLNVAKDKYFRILADVFVDGFSLADILLKEGLAVSYDGGRKEIVKWCDKREFYHPAAMTDPMSEHNGTRKP
jgi:micrococcal nuclease